MLKDCCSKYEARSHLVSFVSLDTNNGDSYILQFTYVLFSRFFSTWIVHFGQVSRISLSMYWGPGSRVLTGKFLPELYWSRTFRYQSCMVLGEKSCLGSKFSGDICLLLSAVFCFLFCNTFLSKWEQKAEEAGDRVGSGCCCLIGFKCFIQDD